MRILALILAVMTMAVCGFFYYCYTGAQMEIEGVFVQAIPAMDKQVTFDDVRDALANDSFYGKLYRDTETLMPEEYDFLTLTVRMRNGGLFPMDWIAVEVAPNEGDVLQLPADRTPSLAPGTRAEFSATLLTRAGGDTRRVVTVTYYVLGNAMEAMYVMP